MLFNRFTGSQIGVSVEASCAQEIHYCVLISLQSVAVYLSLLLRLYRNHFEDFEQELIAYTQVSQAIHIWRLQTSVSRFDTKESIFEITLELSFELGV